LFAGIALAVDVSDAHTMMRKPSTDLLLNAVRLDHDVNALHDFSTTDSIPLARTSQAHDLALSTPVEPCLDGGVSELFKCVEALDGRCTQHGAELVWLKNRVQALDLQPSLQQEEGLKRLQELEQTVQTQRLSMSRLQSFETGLHSLQAWSTEVSAVLLRVEGMDAAWREASFLTAKDVQWAQELAQQTAREVESVVDRLLSIDGRLCTLEKNLKNMSSEEVAQLAARVDTFSTVLEKDKTARADALREMERVTASITSVADQSIQRVLQEIARELESAGISSVTNPSANKSCGSSGDSAESPVHKVHLSHRVVSDSPKKVQSHKLEGGERLPMSRSTMGPFPRVKAVSSPSSFAPSFSSPSSATPSSATSPSVPFTSGFGVPSFSPVDFVPQRSRTPGPDFASSQKARNSPKRWAPGRRDEGKAITPQTDPRFQLVSGHGLQTQTPPLRVSTRSADGVSPALRENLQELVSAIHQTLAGQDDVAILGAS
jgi:hypothetical protein